MPSHHHRRLAVVGIAHVRADDGQLGELPRDAVEEYHLVAVRVDVERALVAPAADDAGMEVDRDAELLHLRVQLQIRIVVIRLRAG